MNHWKRLERLQNDTKKKLNGQFMMMLMLLLMMGRNRRDLNIKQYIQVVHVL